MTPVIYLFRDDLRLHDNPALTAACAAGMPLLPVCLLPEPADSGWGFADQGSYRHAFRLSALRGLDVALRALGSRLLPLAGSAATRLPALARDIGARVVYCEDIATPRGRADIAQLREAGLVVETRWQSSLLDPDELPWSRERLPDVFTAFRHKLEAAGVAPPFPLPVPTLPLLPPVPDTWQATLPEMTAPEADPRSSFPFPLARFLGDETTARAHLAQYLSRGLPHTYKTTRNQLQGVDYSSKLSPWLACGSLSARQAYAELQEFEQQTGRTESSYWLWFELLWRDHFRFLHLKHGEHLYRPDGLRNRVVSSHDAEAFQRWREGRTGEPLVDAGMRELAATGYLSNRLRQVVASYLIHDLGSDWRAGAAWFESALIDFDRYSNQGNWLYIAGAGTDPRGGRRFDPAKQRREHDPSGSHCRAWKTLPTSREPDQA